MMKRLIAAILLAGCCLTAAAQDYVPTPVTVSKEKVKLNGQVYLSHVVLERQTLYSICRAYGVTEEDLYQANPTLRETGLQKNAILLVPYREAAVEEGASKEDYTEHTVRWYEDIDDIAARYNVTVKDIMEANNLKSKKLSTRQVLRIPLLKKETPAPAANEEPATTEPAQTEPAQTEPIVAADTLDAQAVPDSTLLTIKARGNVDFSLVLPLKGGASEPNMDFYSGVLMAVKDLEAQGLTIKANIYDLNAGLPPMDELLHSDFVLGPIASRDLEAILQRVDGRVPVISPLDQKAAALSRYYTNFIQVPTAVDRQYEDLAQWLQEEHQPQDKIILVTEKNANSIQAAIAIRSAMAHRELPYEILNYAIMEGTSLPATLTNLLDQNATNRIVVASESEAFVSDAVRNLGIMLGKGYDIVMYAPSRVRTFDTIEGSAYHQAQLHLCTSYYADYGKEEVDHFVRAYRSLFRTEPSQFAFQGYDTARYFILRASTYGNAWQTRFGGERSWGLHTDFLFYPDEAGNAANSAVRRIIYRKDFTTSLE